MKTEVFRPLPDDAPIAFQRNPQIVIAYEDFETAVKARNTLRHFLGDVPADMASATAFWKFDLLSYPALCEQAVDEARRAEFIMLSLHGDCDLPAGVVGWMRRATTDRTGTQGTLIILLDESAEGSAMAQQIVGNLRALAGRAELLPIPIFSDSGDTELFK